MNSINVKKFLTAFVALGHLNFRSPCPCCSLKRSVMLQKLTRRKQKSNTENHVDEFKK